MLAPIVLFVYNRPWHTKQTLEALMKCGLANESNLYIYADGAKENSNEGELAKIQEVRDIIGSKRWCKQVQIIVSKINKGLANSIIDATTEIVNKYGKVITLEDDVIVGQFFLDFINKGLDLYQDNKNVFMISGYNFPVKKFKKKESSFFLPYMTSQAWGTWQDSWNMFDREAKGYEQLKNNKLLRKKFNHNNSYDFAGLMESQMEKGTINSWAIRFYWTLFKNRGMILYPDQSLVENIGWDGSGTHCTNGNPFKEVMWDSEYLIRNFPKRAVVDRGKLRYLCEYLRNLNGIKRIKDESLLEISKKQVGLFIYKIKSLVPSKVKQGIKRVANKTLYESEMEAMNLKKINDLEETRIQNLPRFFETEISLLHKKIRIVDIASFQFMKKEIFDDEIYKFSTDTDSPYVIDCGANIGLSVIYFKQLYPEAEIIAFEPDQKVFKALENNIEVFNLKKTALINKACWSEETVLPFYSEGADSGRVTGKTDQVNVTEVETVVLKNYLDRKVDFLKIDIEGAENEVLHSIKGSLLNVERIFVEFHSFVGREQMLPEILEILKHAGFRLHLSSPGLVSKNPFIHLKTYAGMDNQLNIYGFR